MANRGCGCRAPTDIRLAAGGGFEASFDNGLTWEQWNGSPDIGGNVPVVPLPPGMTPTNGSCSGAESTAEVFKLFVDFICGNETAWDAITTLLPLILSALLVYFGIGSVVAAIVGVIVVAIFTFTREAFCAMFDEELWEEFRCILYCNINSDASYTHAQLENILQEVFATDWDELAKRWFQVIIGVVNTGGMTNAARTFVNLIADCSECGCTCDDLSIGGIGTDLEAAPDIGAGWWRVTTEFGFPPFPSGNGDFYAIINIPACCCLTAYDYPEGLTNAPPGNRVSIGCDDVTHTGNYGMNAGLINKITWRAFELGTISFKIEEICP